MPRHTATLPTPAPFDLRLALFGHGWIGLPPHEWHEASQTWHTALAHGKSAIAIHVRQTSKNRLRLDLHAPRPLAAATRQRIAARIAHMLRLADDLTPFHQLCAADPQLAWVARRGAGRLLRSATVFEDLLKLLFTTNTTWAGTVAMTERLVAACGPVAPDGRRAFPTAGQCPTDPDFWRQQVKVGYRAAAAVELVEAFAAGALRERDFAGDATQVWQRLVSLRGFGPYAAGQAMRLRGHYEALALDSWCRAQLAARESPPVVPADREVAARYARFAPYQGLALWVDLTAAWHGEGAGD